MLTEWARRVFKPVLDFIASIFLKLHITPNTITVIGLLLSIVVGYLIATNNLLWAGLLYLIAASMDAIDGTMARQMNVRSKFGAFLDSTLDRLGESIVIASVAIWSINQPENQVLGVLVAFAALVFSFLVSYTRARAEGLGYECKVGIGTRFERFIITCASLLLQIPVIGMAVIAVLAGITVVQRVYVVWKQATAEAAAHQ